MKAFGMKRLSVLFMVLAVMVSVLLTSPVMAKQLVFAVLLPTMDQPHWVLQRHGYEDEARKLGIELKIYDAGGLGNLAKQVPQIEDAIASKVDVIILCAVSAAGMVPAAEDAIRAGIPIVNVNLMCDSPKITARVRSDDVEIGRMCGKFLAERLNYKGNIVMVYAPAGISVVMHRSGGFEEVIKKHPGIKVLDKKYVGATRAYGMSTMEDFLQAHGRAINGAMAIGEHLTMGVAKALDAAKRRDVVLVGGDWSADLEQAIRDGWVAGTVLQQTIMMGRLGIRIAKDVAEGKKVPEITFSPIHLVTKENLDTIDRSGFEIKSK